MLYLFAATLDMISCIMATNASNVIPMHSDHDNLNQLRENKKPVMVTKIRLTLSQIRQMWLFSMCTRLKGNPYNKGQYMTSAWNAHTEFAKSIIAATSGHGIIALSMSW